MFEIGAKLRKSASTGKRSPLKVFVVATDWLVVIRVCQHNGEDPKTFFSLFNVTDYILLQNTFIERQ